MPWYTTLYNADSSPIDAQRLLKASDGNTGYHIGRYGNRVYARSKRHAEVLARERGINEAVWLKSHAPNYPRASTALRKPAMAQIDSGGYSWTGYRSARLLPMN